MIDSKRWDEIVEELETLRDAGEPNKLAEEIFEQYNRAVEDLGGFSARLES